MIRFLSVTEASKRALLAPPSYYRLAAAGLLPPVVKLASNRSGVIEEELDAVLRARAVGASNDEVRELLTKMVEQRGERFALPEGSK